MPSFPIQLKRNGTAAATPSSLLHGEVALNYADGKLFWKDASNVIQSFTFQAYALSSHSHGNITNAGAIGSTANLPIITTTSGVLTTGSFGTSAATFCEGNDSRLSDTRTPTDGSVTTAKLANDAVTYAKIQNVSATDRLLGRSSAGSGDVEEITCGSFGRSLIGSADAAAARTTLSVQPTASPAFTGAATVTNDGNVIPLTVTNTGTANSFVVNDASGDTSPFVIDASGNVGVGTSSPSSLGKFAVIGKIIANGGGTEDPEFRLSGASGGVTRNYAIGTDAQQRLYVYDYTAAAYRLEINSSGQLLVTTGSASACGVAFSGDPDTGIAQLSAAGANTLSICTNSGERVRVDASGNVGIGAAPGTTLDIQRASADAAVFVQGQTSSTGATLQLYSGAGLGYVGTRNNYPLLITSNNAERMRVKTTGSVRFVPLSADPSTGNEAGDVYYNSTTNKLRVYNGTSWVDLH